MGSECLGLKSQAALWRSLIKICLIAPALVSVLASCSSSSSSSPSISASATAAPSPAPATTAPGPAGPAGSAPGAAQSAPPSANPFHKVDQEVAGLVQRQAAWQVPKHLDVDNTTRVGLTIGDTTILHTEINELVPGSHPQPAGTVNVGPTIGVQLLADPNDATVVPSDTIDKSIGEHTALLWTWFIYPTHPNSGLQLTAEIIVDMPNGYVSDTELPLSIPVSRTWQYTAGQIFSSWLTWVSIVTVLAAAVGWIWRRRKRPRKPGTPFHTPNPPKKPPTASRRSPGSRPTRRGPRATRTSLRSEERGFP